jgi:hypothetical protein
MAYPYNIIILARALGDKPHAPRDYGVLWKGGARFRGRALIVKSQPANFDKRRHLFIMRASDDAVGDAARFAVVNLVRNGNSLASISCPNR